MIHLKKQFDLPAATVQFGDGERREHEIVGEEDEGFVLCGVTIFDAPQMVGVVRSTIDTGEPDGLIADQPGCPGPNPRAGNQYGQIVRWRPDGGNHLAAGFAWDLYVMAGNPAVHSDANAGSKNVNTDNMFNSPDGIAFDRNGLLWIQTDGNYSDAKGFAGQMLVAGQGNNQMLVGDPVTTAV